MASRWRTKTQRAEIFRISLYAETLEALRRFADDRSMAIQTAIELIVEAELVAQSLLEPKRSCEMFKEGWNNSMTPWEDVSELPWYSPKKNAKTWATLFEEFEFNSSTSLKQLASKYQLPTSRIRSQFRRFDAWRRGAPVMAIKRLSREKPIFRDDYSRHRLPKRK